MPNRPTAPPAKSAEKKKRKWLTIPVTEAMLEAVKRAARRRGLNQSNFARQYILEQTEYDSDTDPDLPELLRSKEDA